MRAARAIGASVATVVAGLRAIGFGPRRTSELRPAWTAWANGEVRAAWKLAQDALEARRDANEAHHLLFLTTFVMGEYRTALAHYAAIDASYPPLAELTETAVDAYVHLGAIDDALNLARRHEAASASTIRRLEEHLVRPMTIDLTSVAVVPFAEHPFTEYLPAFSTEINGRRIAAHLDTGGTYLHMGPERAAALGISTVSGGKGEAHLDRASVDWSYGIAECFVLGDIVFHNAPVEVVSTLAGDSDFVLFGTNILEPFLSTLDHPHRRLVLSKRGDAPAAEAHVAMLPRDHVSVPFYLWSDHFMFARGSFGDRQDLNFFVDTGLLALDSDGTGGTRQASFTSSKRRFKQWGIPAADIKRGIFESPAPLGLGPLREDRPLLVVGAAGDREFGGVRIDGLISYGFLKRYAWTVDFDRREYRLSR